MTTKIIIAVVAIVIVLAAIYMVSQQTTEQKEEVPVLEFEEIERSLNASLSELEEFPEENLIPEGF